MGHRGIAVVRREGRFNLREGNRLEGGGESRKCGGWSWNTQLQWLGWAALGGAGLRWAGLG